MVVIQDGKIRIWIRARNTDTYQNVKVQNTVNWTKIERILVSYPPVLILKLILGPLSSSGSAAALKRTGLKIEICKLRLNS